MYRVPFVSSHLQSPHSLLPPVIRYLYSLFPRIFLPFWETSVCVAQRNTRTCKPRDCRVARSIDRSAPVGARDRRQLVRTTAVPRDDSRTPTHARTAYAGERGGWQIAPESNLRETETAGTVSLCPVSSRHKGGPSIGARLFSLSPLPPASPRMTYNLSPTVLSLSPSPHIDPSRYRRFFFLFLFAYRYRRRFSQAVSSPSKRRQLWVINDSQTNQKNRDDCDQFFSASFSRVTEM